MSAPDPNIRAHLFEPERHPDIVYPSGDTDVPEIDGLKMEPVYSEVQQALIAHFADRDDVLVAGNSFVYFKVEGHPQPIGLVYLWPDTG